MGCCSFPQGIFTTQGLNLSLLHCRQILCCLSHQGRPMLHFVNREYWRDASRAKRHLTSIFQFSLSTGTSGWVCGWPSLTLAALTDQLQLCTQAPSCPPDSRFHSNSSFIPRQKASSCLPYLLAMLGHFYIQALVHDSW